MNLFASPLKPGEFLAATMIISLSKVGAVLIVSVLVAWAFYSFNLFILGISLIPFILNLIIMGWVIGILTTAIIMRYGQEAEVLAWGMVFIFQPVSCVFYPISVLPGFLQTVAQLIPAAHVFEGMRDVITNSNFPLTELMWASGLNAIYLFAAILWFHYVYGVAKDKGILVRVGG
jgi:ABC-2 type transport system permease protein